jgi:hypothetical protein
LEGIHNIYDVPCYDKLPRAFSITGSAHVSLSTYRSTDSVISVRHEKRTPSGFFELMIDHKMPTKYIGKYES